MASETSDPRVDYLRKLDSKDVGPSNEVATCGIRDSKPNVTIIDDVPAKVPVRVTVHIQEIRDIDTVKQWFWCRVMVRLTWLVSKPKPAEPAAGTGDASTIASKADTEPDNASKTSKTDADPGYWYPKLDFVNCNVKVVVKHEVGKFPVKLKNGDYFYNHCSYSVHGYFYERMELGSFPFDMQRLHIRAVLWDCPAAVKYVPFSKTYTPPSRVRDQPRTIKFEKGSTVVYENDGFTASDAWMMYDVWRGSVKVQQQQEEAQQPQEEAQQPQKEVQTLISRLKALLQKVEHGKGKVQQPQTLEEELAKAKKRTQMEEEGEKRKPEELRWQLDRAIQVKQGLTRYQRQTEGAQYTTLNIYVSLQRRPQTYLMNIILPIALLSCISLGPFCFGTEQFSDRLNITVQVLLAMAAIKLTIAQYVPATAYATIMDWYIMASFAFVFIVSVTFLGLYWTVSTSTAPSMPTPSPPSLPSPPGPWVPPSPPNPWVPPSPAPPAVEVAPSSLTSAASKLNRRCAIAFTVVWGVLQLLILGCMSIMRSWHRRTWQQDEMRTNDDVDLPDGRYCWPEPGATATATVLASSSTIKPEPSQQGVSAVSHRTTSSSGGSPLGVASSSQSAQHTALDVPDEADAAASVNAV